MTLDHAVALSLLGVSRLDLTSRLRDDPRLLEMAQPLLPRARAVRARAAAAGLHVVAWNDDGFPAMLRSLTDLPPALWFRGDLTAASAPGVAIVGSRAASAVALETAARLAEDLAARGLTVVSGLARGVDTAAHRAALRAGRTVAVLGSGVDRIYPAEHAELAVEIARTGAVVSEQPPGMPPLPHHFPLRNRLISGLSLAVVVIEASEKSGSLITASCALEQGRDVMVVPGTVIGGRNRGGHALLRDGARLVETADDVVEELAGRPGIELGGSGSSLVVSSPCSDPVLAAMTPGEACALDDLVAASGLDSAQLLPRLLDLELRGLVRRTGGSRFLRPS